jgi:endonuclease/exonuclease/phosphatase family metal-dependent hydrolase
MSRKLLTATIIINNESFQISTVHLESLSNSKLRNQQLKIASEVLKDDTSLLMGDFNFDSLKNHIDILPLENDCLKEYFPDFLDLWSHLRNERGYTFDNEVNHMIKGKDRSRYDRIIMKSESWECEKIEIIGNDPIQIDDTVKIFPSDHFGLKVELKYKNIENS